MSSINYFDKNVNKSFLSVFLSDDIVIMLICSAFWQQCYFIIN